MSPWRWLLRALGLRTGGLYLLLIRHDRACPALRTQLSEDCTCPRVIQELHDVTDDPSAAARFLAIE